MSNMRDSLVRDTAISVANYIDEKYIVLVDVDDLIKVIDNNIGFVVDAVLEQQDFYEGLLGGEDEVQAQ